MICKKSLWDRIVDRLLPPGPVEQEFLKAEVDFLASQQKLIAVKTAQVNLVLERKKEQIKRRDARRKEKQQRENERARDFRAIAWVSGLKGKLEINGKQTTVDYIINLNENLVRHSAKRRNVTIKRFNHEDGTPIDNKSERSIPGHIMKSDLYNRWINPWCNWKLSTEDLKKCDEIHFPGNGD